MRIGRRSGSPGHSAALGSVVVGVLAMGLSSASPAAAASPPTITTPYPAISVQPGSTATIRLTVDAATAERVDLALDGVPDGWRASLSGGGSEVQSVYTDPGTPVELSLDVTIPADAADGTSTITVGGSADGARGRLAIDLNVAQQAGGSVSITSDFPSLRGTADKAFSFSLQLANDTPQQLTFGLQAQGPAGWDVTVEPTGQTTAASVAVDARASQGLTVTATPPGSVAAGTYQIGVTATSGDQTASAQLGIEVTGKVSMTLTTPDQRLNATATAGTAQDFAVVVENSGSSPLDGVALTGTGPSDWTITFDPPVTDPIPPNSSVNATAHITPSADAVAGDYAATLTGSSGDTTESIDIRVTVETPPIWGIVGALLILGTLGGLAWVFRRYGRR